MTTETQTRHCVGSTRFGIEAHDADAGDFPVQPSQKDGLGRMCKPHWRQYTNALCKAAVARKAEAEPEAPAPAFEPEVIEAPGEVTPEPETPAPPDKPRRTKAEPTVADAVQLPPGHTTGPGRESGACVYSIGPGRHGSGQRRPRWPVAPTGNVIFDS